MNNFTWSVWFGAVAPNSSLNADMDAFRRAVVGSSPAVDQAPASGRRQGAAEATLGTITAAGSLPALTRPDDDMVHRLDSGSRRHVNGDDGDQLMTLKTMRNEVESLRRELTRSRDVIAKMQDREKQLRERCGFFCSSTVR